MPTMRSPEGRLRIVPDHTAQQLEGEGWSDVHSAPEPPNVSDLKEDWVAYAQTQGYDPDEGLTKQQLIEQYG